MKKIIFITILLGCIPLILMGYRVYDYYDYKSINYKRISNINKEIEKVNKDIINKKDSIEQVKNSNSEKIKLLELWQKRLKKIK